MKTLFQSPSRRWLLLLSWSRSASACRLEIQFLCSWFLAVVLCAIDLDSVYVVRHSVFKRNSLYSTTWPKAGIYLDYEFKGLCTSTVNFISIVFGALSAFEYVIMSNSHWNVWMTWFSTFRCNFVASMVWLLAQISLIYSPSQLGDAILRKTSEPSALKKMVVSVVVMPGDRNQHLRLYHRISPIHLDHAIVLANMFWHVSKTPVPSRSRSYSDWR